MKDLRVNMSTMVLCNANGIVVIECDTGRSGLPSAPIDIEYDNNSIEY